MSTTKMKTVSLVLGSGGARGLAHIGVIHWLEENDFKIGSIAGCSIGAVIGGVYAAGKLNEYEQWVRSITIAVNLGGSPEGRKEPASVSAAPVDPSSPFREKIKGFITSFQQSGTSGSSRDWGAYDIAMQAFDTMQSAIARQKLAAYPPDIVIEIARNACRTLEFDRASEMIELGYSKAKECLSQAVPQNAER
jgi:predicted acylesterase/phospholipase RssA